MAALLLLVPVCVLVSGATAVVGAPPAEAVVACSSTVPPAMEPSNLWPRAPAFTVWADPTGMPWPLTPADLDASMRQAVAEWDDDPDSAIAIKYAGLRTDHLGAANDGTHVVFWDVLPPGTVATTSLYSGPFGVLAGFDTILNRTLPFSAGTAYPPTGYDLTTTLRHELGHGIGLCHDSQRGELMYPTQALGPAGVRGLTPGALAEVRRQYRNQELTTVVDDGRGPPTLVRTGRNALYQRVRDVTTDAWAPERPLGPTTAPPGVNLVGTAAAGRDPDGRIELAVVGSDGALYQSWQRGPNGTFTPWASRATGVRPGVALARNRDGRLELFTNGVDGIVRASWQVDPGGAWLDWLDVPDVAPVEDGLAAATNHDGRLELFALGADGALWHRWQIDAGRGPWTSWLPVPGVTGSHLAVAPEADGRLHLFVLDADQRVAEAWQVTPDSTWSDWAVTAPIVLRTGLAALRNPDEPRLEVFGTALDGQATWHAWQEEPNGSWTSWEPLP